MLGLLFFIGFIPLAIFIPQATSGLTWIDLFKIIQSTDDQWLKELTITLNLQYTTPTQFATQKLLICLGILIGYIIIAIVITKLIYKLENKHNNYSNTHYESKNEQKTTFATNSKYGITIKILSIGIIISIIMMFAFQNLTLLEIFGIALWIQIISLIIISNIMCKKIIIPEHKQKIKQEKPKEQVKKEAYQPPKNENKNAQIISMPKVNTEKLKALQIQRKLQNQLNNGENTNGK